MSFGVWVCLGAWFSLLHGSVVGGRGFGVWAWPGLSLCVVGVVWGVGRGLSVVGVALELA